MRHLTLSFIALMSICLGLITSSVAYALEARVDRTTLPQNETFQLELSGTFSAFNLNIDLSPLEKDFRVLDNRRSTNMQYINGDFSAKTTLTITLEPKKSGVLTVPAITIEGESSDPIRLKVTKSNNTLTDSEHQAPPLDIEFILENPTSWVQAKQVMKIRLYQSVQLFNLELHGVKELQQLGFEVEKIGENKTYQSKRHNITYQVTELNYLLSSDNPGEYEFPEFVFEGQMPTRNSRYGKRLEARTKPLQVTIKDIPKDYPSANWIPATDLQISDDLQPITHLNTGDSLNRNLVISVQGQEAAVIPDIPEPNSNLVSIYSDAPELNNQITLEGITGVRMDNIALISKHPGKITLPEIKVPWFNIQTATTEYAVLPQRVIEINGSLPSSTYPSTSHSPTTPKDASKSGSFDQTPMITDKHQSKTKHPEIKQPLKDDSAPYWMNLILIILSIAFIVQSIINVVLFRKLRAKEDVLDAPSPKPLQDSHWNHPLPSDFASCYLLIQKALEKHHLNYENLSEEAINLINQFRESAYGSPSSTNSFSESDRETLRLSLKQFFSKQSKSSNGPKLYPE